ncbi:MAG: protocatechuate 4,5-dioxygenase, alpha chain [Betaproteobacteria bacterium]|jgi:protocatechuate 4,5-dioxygenase alpha subunit|nr:protocatechuate 4,5-dioxygenase, alpha chain [Betaproteobacteria bacterium]
MGKPLAPIPDTSIFDLRLSLRGKRLNKMCAALCSPAERDAFKRDEEAFMAKFSLSEEEKNLIRKRDFKGLIEAGMNIYAMLKVGSATGNSLYRMGAQMRGESYEEFLKTRNIKDAV